nr:hypothetical protein [Tanacetum cinerariifolium]
MDNVLDCVMPYIHGVDDLNSISLICRKGYELDCITRKHVTVHVPYASNPFRLSQRFPYIESLALKGFPCKHFGGNVPAIQITPWIQEITVKSFKCLKELCIRDMVVSDSDLELLVRKRDFAKKCSNSLVSLKTSSMYLSDLGDAFSHAVKLEYFGGAKCDENEDYSSFKFPRKIRGLCIDDLPRYLIPFLYPYVDQLRELDLACIDMEEYCQCFLIKRCPNLEVLRTSDACGDIGLQVIGQFCKKLRKLTHDEYVTHMGLIALAQGCPNLENLDVALLDISNEAIECVGIHLKNLRDLHMDFVKKDGTTDLPLDNGIRALLMGCTKLEMLHISLYPGGLTDMGMGYIGKYGHNLKYLFLECVGESDAGFVKLSYGCPKLRELVMNDCPFSKQVIEAFVFNIHSLRSRNNMVKSEGEIEVLFVLSLLL